MLYLLCYFFVLCLYVSFIKCGFFVYRLTYMFLVFAYNKTLRYCKCSCLNVLFIIYALSFGPLCCVLTIVQIYTSWISTYCLLHMFKPGFLCSSKRLYVLSLYVFINCVYQISSHCLLHIFMYLYTCTLL